MPAILHIHAKFHDILFDMSTGDFRVEKSELSRKWRPDYFEMETPEFDKMLRGVFRLSGEFYEMERHFYELMGDLLYRDGSKLDSRVILFGDAGSCGRLAHIAKCVTNLHLSAYFAPLNYGTIFFDGYDYNVLPIDYHVDVLHFQEMLWPEIPGIFFKSVTGLSRLLKRGKFDTPKPCIDAHRSLFRNMDPIGNFIEDRCVFARDAVTSVKCLYTAFMDYTNGAHQIGRTELVRELQSRGVTLQKGAHNMLLEVTGLALKLK